MYQNAKKGGGGRHSMLVYFFTKVARTVRWGGEAIQAMPESKTFFMEVVPYRMALN